MQVTGTRTAGIGLIRPMAVQRPITAKGGDRQRRASDPHAAARTGFAATPSRAMEVEAAAQPRLPFLVELDREKTADAFLGAARRATELAAQSGQAPLPFAIAALEAVSLSDQHNQHCRAGLPIDEKVQQARRDIDGAIAAFLAAKDCDVPFRGKLLAARDRLARLGADFNKDRPMGVRSVIYGEVSRWLAPHDVQAMSAASKVPDMSHNAYERAEIVCAQTSLSSLKLALDVAHRAHLASPGNVRLATRYQHRLKETYIAMELMFNDANKAYGIAEQAGIEVLFSVPPADLEHRTQCQRVYKEKKENLLKIAADFRKVASQRKSVLQRLCEGCQPGDEPGPAQLELALDQLGQVNTLLALCEHLRLTFAPRTLVGWQVAPTNYYVVVA